MTALHKKSHRGRLPETVFPSHYLMIYTEEKVIDDVLALLNKHGMDAKQSLELLEHLGRTLEMGMMLTKPTTHSPLYRFVPHRICSDTPPIQGYVSRWPTL